jgi:hypothetical protein
MTTKWYFDVDEWYPVFTLTEDERYSYNSSSAELTDDELAQIKEAEEKFYKAQDLIATRFAWDRRATKRGTKP